MSGEKRGIRDVAVLGINLAVFAAYVILGVYDNSGTWFIISLWHVAICIIMAIIQKRWIWVLAALIILVIGCATCFNTFHLDTK
jgi:hypothetical protein